MSDVEASPLREKRTKTGEDQGQSQPPKRRKATAGRIHRTKLKAPAAREEPEETNEVDSVMHPLAEMGNSDRDKVNYFRASVETCSTARLTNFYDGEKEAFDFRFYAHFHADWYRSTYLRMKHTRKERHKVHKGNHMDAEDMRYMYVDPDNCSPPNSNGLKPFFSVLFRICRSTLAPRGGNFDRIPAFQRDILHWVHGNRKFDVFDYVYQEMWDISISPKRGCGYAPHIMFIIEKVSGLTFNKDMKHLSLKPQIPSNWTPDTTSGQFFGAAQPPSSAAPPQPPRAAPQGTGSSHVPPPPRSKRSGIMKMFKSLMSLCRSINQRLNVIERNQKGLYDHFGIETPPPPSPAEGSPPPTHDDPTFTIEEMNYFGYYPTPPPFSSGAGSSAQHIRFEDDDGEGDEDEAVHALRQRKGKEPAIDEVEEEEGNDDDEYYEFSDD
ncbi:hypothetical protein PR202_ga08122 [Eleusine coracana subsp. coracana]|uniref:Uncharacterized protein n=1 Tax=Eleusine coracana subsp. coracana TaxID=191504 RepID=A0AAV5BZR7_ELECO|nr:hypothetical protein PR202_ga08122 [Eleusine coracana subsp. coracana]